MDPKTLFLILKALYQAALTVKLFVLLHRLAWRPQRSHQLWTKDTRSLFVVLAYLHLHICSSLEISRGHVWVWRGGGGRL